MAASKQKILIADNEKSVRRLLNRKLSREGYDCKEADSAVQTLERLDGKLTDLVILDIKMRGKSGIDLLLEIQTRFPDTAVIVSTAVSETDVAIRCMQQGADDYLCKPFDLNEIVPSVERTLRKIRLQNEIKERYQSLVEETGGQTTEIRRLFLSAVKALVSSLEANDKYFAGHSQRVTEIALAIGQELNLSENDREDLQWGSLLHDVGKIAVDHFLQNKPTKLTLEEYQHIMIHAHVGAGIIKPVVNEKVVAIVQHHHDHYDGSGIHQDITNTDIPLGARILAVADAFDAMISDRSYRKAMSVEEACAELERCKGTQFDPVVVETFLRIRAPAEISVFPQFHFY